MVVVGALLKLALLGGWTTSMCARNSCTRNTAACEEVDSQCASKQQQHGTQAMLLSLLGHLKRVSE